MKCPKARSLVELLLLSGTAICLLGHGFNSSAPSCDERNGQTASYNVTGTCGPAGVITVTQSNLACRLEITGDQVGLPASGNPWGKIGDGFSLSGSLDGDWDVTCATELAGTTDASVTLPGELLVSCRRYPAGTNPAPDSPTYQDWCRADLVPVTQTCDLHTCPTPACPRGQHTVLSQPRCCVVCVDDTPADVIPGMQPDACRPEKCPKDCPAGQEINIDGGVCCGSCQPVAQTCLDGRALWRSEVATKWKTALVCNVDVDCTLTVAGGVCGSSCLDAIAVAQISSFSAWANARSKELCSTCFGQSAATDCSDDQIRGSICSNGTCQTKK
jgi:hypothetical protein